MICKTKHSSFCGWLLAAALASCVGCGGGDFPLADVSGTVTLDNAPLEDALVRFMPQRQSDSPLSGPTSMGVTDSEGRYQLETLKGDNGAVVGPHMVLISTHQTEAVDMANSDEVRVIAEERVPERYRNGELTFEVQPDGTDSADFNLESN